MSKAEKINLPQALGARRPSRPLHIGPVQVGNGAPISVQSMTNTDTRDTQSTLEQIHRLAKAGCEIIRAAVPDQQAAQALGIICQKSPLPLVADIHFDARLAVLAIEAGAAGLRINPGNIGGEKKLDRVVDAAKMHKIPIRIGVNAGSLEKNMLERYKGICPEAMVESALSHIRMLERRDFFEIKVSLKASSVPLSLAAYRFLSEQCPYPLHLGITEAGGRLQGTVKSAVGIGILLAEGLGDTIRVSLTDDPEQEIAVAWQILSALGLRRRGPEIISCPTCGRTEIDLISLAKAVEEQTRFIERPISIAVMGCSVNGPGEAKEADVGIAGGRGKGVLFRKGKIIGSVTGGQNELLQALLEQIHLTLQE